MTVTFPSMTYTPGGAAVSWTVAVPTGPGGFELSTRVLSNNSQAGTLTAGTGSNVATSGAVQYLRQSSNLTSWTFSWTPPATDAGNVAVYVVGVGSTFGATFSNSYILTPAVSTPPGTLTVNPTTLGFTSDGTMPPTQAVQVSSSGAPIAVTTSVATNSGGNWLSATPPGANTPFSITVGANPAGLAVGSYTGTVTIASANATNSPRTVSVTFDVTAPPPPPTPTLTLSSTALTFNGTPGGTAAPRTVQVTSSDASPLVFAADVSTTSGGNWLTASPASGTTPATESVSVDLTGLAVGTYQGLVTFTSAGASNSPVTLGVTLNVTSQTPPPTNTPLRFSFNVRDRQSGGSDRLLLDGTGSVDSSGAVTGGGHFTRYRSGRGEDGRSAIIATGTWKATSVTSFTPVNGGGGEDRRRSGGTLVLQVQVSTQGGTSSAANMRIASTGSESGVTLTIDGGATFEPTGTGRVSITTTSGGGSDDGEDGGSDN